MERFDPRRGDRIPQDVYGRLSAEAMRVMEEARSGKKPVQKVGELVKFPKVRGQEEPSEFQLKMLALAQAEGLVPASKAKGLNVYEENRRLIKEYGIKDVGEDQDGNEENVKVAKR
ncbi:MAG: hypothetical protein AAB678_00005 [Patescibacteria group bacterium]